MEDEIEKMGETGRIKEEMGDLIVGAILIGLGCGLLYIGAWAAWVIFTTQATGVDAVILSIGGALLAFGLFFIGVGLVPFTYKIGKKEEVIY